MERAAAAIDPKEARKAYKREWAARNREKIREYNRKYKAKKAQGKARAIKYSRPAPGATMTEEEYRAAPAVNKSTLWWIRKSPAHYKNALDNPPADTPAWRTGRAIHAAILQPALFKEHYAILPAGIDRRTKAGREEYNDFISEAGDKEILTEEEAATIERIAQAVRKDKAAAALLEGCQVETPIFWTDQATGIECKCRVDAMKPGIAVDLKSCADASTGAFLRDALKYGYDVQAAHYLRGIRSQNGGQRVEWYFIAIEKAEPFAVNVIHASDGFIDRGTWQLMGLLDKLKECREAGAWPGYGENELILPEWAEIPDDE